MTLKDVEFSVSGGTAESDEIMRCLRNLIMTPAGTAPLDRDFGIDTLFLDMPADAAQSLLAVEIIEKAERYEPRVSVREVELYPDTDGKITAKVAVEIV